jgi:lysozyme
MNGVRTYGIDISAYSGKVDWDKVLANQIHFVLARASFVRLKNGKLSEHKDSQFLTYWAALGEKTVRRGAYQFCRPEYDADKSIALLFSAYTPTKGDIVPTLDIEDRYADIKSVSRKDKVKQIRRMVELTTERLNGRKPMIYTKKRVWDALGNPAEFSDCPLWVIHYNNDYEPILPKSWSTFAFWQTGENKKMKGIAGDYDPDFFNGTPQDLSKVCL